MYCIELSCLFAMTDAILHLSFQPFNTFKLQLYAENGEPDKIYDVKYKAGTEY